jgi:nucleoid-associated protein YgaU
MPTALLAAALCALPLAPGETSSTVQLPLSHLETMLRRIEAKPAEPEPPAPYVLLGRKLTGSFQRGLLHATLTARYRVLDAGGYLAIPVLDQTATVESARLDGKPVALERGGDALQVGIRTPGTYLVEVGFYRGQEQDRFTRRLQVQLPHGGPTEVELDLPEQGIEAALARGVLLAQEVGAQGTRIRGYLDTSGLLDLSWTRKLTHKADQAARLRQKVTTLVTVGRSLMEAVSQVELEVEEGSLDRVELTLPEGVEVLEVTGDAVLQWRTQKRQLTVLLRYLLDGESRLVVRYQYAFDPQAEVPVLAITPPGGGGMLGVQAPAGLKVEAAGAAEAQAVLPHDLPPELSAAAREPLVLGFDLAKTPAPALRVSTLQTVELATAVIDEIEASTVVLEDGAMITKARLHLRNNARQALTVVLPEGARLTQARLDGQPVEPAVGEGGGLRFPLRQSKQVQVEGEIIHQVEPGETLGDIALRYYSDPEKWPRLVAANPKVISMSGLVRSGRKIRIPAVGPLTVEESSFILELAWEDREGHPLGAVGTRELSLPSLDLPALRLTWHVYLPTATEALDFTGNVAALGYPREGLHRRIWRRLDRAWRSPAWAVGSKYESVLSTRRRVYAEENAQEAEGDPAPASFPLFGRRYRFNRVLVDLDQPRIEVVYARGWVLDVVRWSVLGLAAVLVIQLGGRRWRPVRWALAGLGMGVFLLIGHYVLGVNRHLVWGIDLGLLVGLWRVRPRGLRWRELFEAPWRMGEVLTVRNLLVMIGALVVLEVVTRTPGLRAVALMVPLAWLWVCWQRRASREVAHV